MLNCRLNHHKKRYFNVKFSVHILLLGLIPLCLFIALSSIISVRGPLWLGLNQDPSYCYLFNSLLLLNHQSPVHVDHPGTTTQVIGYFLMFLLKGKQSLQDFNLYVLMNPEDILNTIIYSIICGTALFLYIFGILILRETKNILVTLLLQVTLLCYGQIYFGMCQFRPELLFPFLSVPLTYILYRLIKYQDSKYFTILSGLLCGLLLINKWTFLPFIFLPLVCIRTIKYKILYIFSLLVSALSLLAIISRQIFRSLIFVYNVLTHASPGGHYGEGATRVIDFDTILPNLLSLFQSNVTLFVVILITFFLVLKTFISVKLKTLFSDNYFSALIVLMGSEIASLIIVASHISDHYLTAMVCILPLHMLIMYELFIRYFNKNIFMKYQNLFIIILLLFIIDSFIQYKKQYNYYSDSNLGQNKVIKEVNLLNKYDKNFVLEYYGSSSLKYSLCFGNEYAGFYFSNYLTKLYPNYLALNIFNYKLENYSSFLDSKIVLNDNSQYKLYFTGRIRILDVNNLPIIARGNCLLSFSNSNGYIYKLQK